MNEPVVDSSGENKTTNIVVCSCLTLVLIGLAMAGAFVYFGADRVPEWILVNNAGKQLTVNFIVDGRSYVLPIGENVAIPPLTDWVFTVEAEKGNEQHYKLAPVERGSVVNNKIYLQIESDGSIYLLTSATQQPARNLSPQPTGYPLRPK